MYIIGNQPLQEKKQSQFIITGSLSFDVPF